MTASSLTFSFQQCFSSLPISWRWLLILYDRLLYRLRCALSKLRSDNVFVVEVSAKVHKNHTPFSVTTQHEKKTPQFHQRTFWISNSFNFSSSFSKLILLHHLLLYRHLLQLVLWSLLNHHLFEQVVVKKKREKWWEKNTSPYLV